MSEQPLVSIITPSYNQSAFIEAAIRSVLSQDYPRVEYWIVDGGSTDGSLEIIETYADRFAGWISEPDHGQADAINKGFKRASGDIIAWINSDDLYRPQAIQRAVSIFQNHPEVGLVYSDVDSIDDRGECFNRMVYDQWQLPDLMAFKILGQPSVFFRRSVLEAAGGLDTSYHYLLDHHLWMRMALAAPIKYVPGQVWAAARMHAGAKNVTAAAGFGEEAYRLVDWMRQDAQFAPYYHRQSRKIWAGAHRLNAFYLLNGDQPAACLNAYWRGFKQDPGTVLKDWRRILYALATTLLDRLGPLKLNILRDSYLDRRKKRLAQNSFPAESERDHFTDEDGI